MKISNMLLRDIKGHFIWSPGQTNLPLMIKPCL